jgi:CBS domain-containing protein
MNGPNIPKELREIAEKTAKAERPTTTVRTLLSWFWGSQRRGSFINRVIRTALNALNIVTIPDFEATFIDGQITFVQKEELAKSAFGVAESKAVYASGQDSIALVDSGSFKVRVDPTHRVARLKSAHTKPVSATPDSSVSQAVTVMMNGDFSQLPVMIGDRVVKGLISWKSLCKKQTIGGGCSFVREAMEPAHIIELQDSLFEAIRVIANNDCVLVRDSEQKICGIITAYDIGATFGELAEPFLLLGEIENHIRSLIEDKFSKQDLQEARDPLDQDRPVDDASDLSFGGYVRLLQNPDNWEKLSIRLDRATFVKALDNTRSIRNNVMHFDPDGIEEKELQKLRNFATLLRQVQQLQVN